MNLREQREELETKTLSRYATLSKNTRGRDSEIKPCDIRTDFQRDRDRIIHSKAFRRLKHKTQVFISPEGDHYRTRLTHTLEVAQIARTIARALKLNEDLAEAIALGHDLGHTPFGHIGEHAINEASSLGFRHYEQSLRVVERIENKGKGLNLTWEVRDGIVNHPTARKPSTLEGKVVRLADKIAYVNHDIDDAIRGKVIKPSDLPRENIDVLGQTCSERINTIIHDIVKQSLDINDIRMTQEIETALMSLRKYMFQNVYIGSKAKEHEQKAKNMLIQLFLYFKDKVHLLPVEFQEMMENGNETLEQIVCDYIAGMTDRYAIRKFYELFIPPPWKVL